MYGTTVIKPGTIIVLVIGCGFLFLLKRQYAIIPFLVPVFFITEAQRIIVGVFDFTILRIFIITGILRTLIRNEKKYSANNSNIDKIFILFLFFGFFAYIFVRQQISAIVTRLGWLYDLLGIYYLFRVFIRNRSDVWFSILVIAIVTIVIGGAIFIEYSTQTNPFFVFGGVSEFTAIRSGVVRCQGPFMHPLLSGAFGASLAPIFLIFFIISRKKILFLIAFISSVFIVIASGSSGPLLGLFAGFLGILAYWLRGNLRIFAIGGLFSLIPVAIAMDAPIWALINRVGVIGGSTGYHRYALIDAAIRRFPEWWFLGIPTTEHWGWGLWDVTNHYIKLGVEGGLLTLILFVIFLFSVYRRILYSINLTNSRYEVFSGWALVASLFVHMVVFFGMTYWGGQAWAFFLLIPVAMIAWCNSRIVFSQNK